MPYCPICNLHGVAEDHSIQLHGVQPFIIWTSTDSSPKCNCPKPNQGSSTIPCPIHSVFYWTGTGNNTGTNFRFTV